MYKPYVTALASFFIWATVTLGQTPYAQRAPVSDAPPAPIADAQPAPASEVPLVAAPSTGDEFKPAFCKEFGRYGSGVFTVEPDFALWFLANSRTSFPVATSQAASILGSLGDAEHGKNEPVSGGRLTLGYWLIEENKWVTGGIRDLGVEARFFFVGQRSVDFQNDVSPTIVRPFFDVNARQDSGFVVAAPGVATGSITAHAKVDIWGAETNVWKSVDHDYPGTVSALSLMGGFRFLSADHQLQIGSFSSYNPNLPATSAFFPLAGNSLAVLDSFTVHNRFYGGQVGVAGQTWLAPWVLLQGTLKLAVGVTNEDLNIEGSQLRTFANGQTQAFTGGVLALPSNSGHSTRDKFAQVPEAEIKLSSRVTNHVTLSGGFSALYWSRIARAAQQIDREIDVTQIPNFPLSAGTLPTNLARPSVPYRQSDLWVLGISLGVEINW